jgi:hypothetical protein
MVIIKDTIETLTRVDRLSTERGVASAGGAFPMYVAARQFRHAQQFQPSTAVLKMAERCEQISWNTVEREREIFLI